MFPFWFLRLKKTVFDPWEIVTTAKIPQLVQYTWRSLEDSRYQILNDAEGDISLNLQQHMLFHAVGNHSVAPLSSPTPLILDVGVSTDPWANEMARLFPDVVAVGVGLSDTLFEEPSQQNCLLHLGNASLPFPEGFFYAHQRQLVAGIAAANWARVIRKQVCATRINGWVELIEANSLAEGAEPNDANIIENRTWNGEPGCNASADCTSPYLPSASRRRLFDRESFSIM